MKYAKDVECNPQATVSVSVSCDDCGEELEISHIEAGDKYHPENIYVTVVSHECKVIT